jgi:ABC-type sugar transport system permease subunit
MENIEALQQSQTPAPETVPETPKKKHRLSSRAKDYIFVGIMLLYPVLQFVITWAFVNINALTHAFQVADIHGNYSWCGFDQFTAIFDNIFHSTLNTTGVSWLNNTSVILLNSLGFAIITIFISLPLSIIFSYFLSKNMPAANVFRVIFFLPNIIPIVALAFAFAISFDSTYGYLYDFMRWLGFKDNFFAVWPTSQLMVYLYCIWAGLGYNVILLSGAIGRIPKELFESAKIDAAGYWKELFNVVIPCIWPTIVTLVVLGMTNVLTLYLQPYLLTAGEGNTYTISLDIFMATASYSPSQYCTAAAKGLLASLLWAPLILLVRQLMSKKYEDVDY